MTDKDEIHKRTLAKMFHGAKMEHQKHDELVTARKKLKTQLEVNFHLKAGHKIHSRLIFCWI